MSLLLEFILYVSGPYFTLQTRICIVTYKTFAISVHLDDILQLYILRLVYMKEQRLQIKGDTCVLHALRYHPKRVLN